MNDKNLELLGYVIGIPLATLVGALIWVSSHALQSPEQYREIYANSSIFRAFVKISAVSLVCAWMAVTYQIYQKHGAHWKTYLMASVTVAGTFALIVALKQNSRLRRIGNESKKRV